MSSLVCCALLVAASTTAAELPAFEAPVAADSLLGLELELHHFDEDRFPESATGLLLVEVDEEVGPITMMQEDSPHYVEAQFTNRQRDGVFLARTGDREDPRPDGTSFAIPYGYGALKTTMSVVTLVEAQLKPHFSDNQKSYELFPLSDLYLGGALSLTGPALDARYVHTESLAVYTQLGLNLPAIAGVQIADTYGAYAVGFTAGAGYRYPSLLRILGTHWTSGVELRVGAIAADDDPDTHPLVLMTGLVQEFEWTMERPLDILDHRSDARPSNWGLHSLFGKVGLYLDVVSGGSGLLLVDIGVGYRFNLLGPTVPPHEFKGTTVTYASQRYIDGKKEEEARRQALEELMQRRKQAQ